MTIDAIQIFGSELRPMMEYVGWIEEQRSDELQAVAERKYKSHLIFEMTAEALNLWRINKIRQAHAFLSQPMDIGYFLRPDEPDTAYMYLTKSHNDAYWEKVKAFENWTPMFKGEWRVTDSKFIAIRLEGKEKFKILGKVTDWNTLNDFATHCFNDGIKLELEGGEM